MSGVLRSSKWAVCASLLDRRFLGWPPLEGARMAMSGMVASRDGEVPDMRSVFVPGSGTSSSSSRGDWASSMILRGVEARPGDLGLVLMSAAEKEAAKVGEFPESEMESPESLWLSTLGAVGDREGRSAKDEEEDLVISFSLPLPPLDLGERGDLRGMESLADRGDVGGIDKALELTGECLGECLGDGFSLPVDAGALSRGEEGGFDSPRGDNDEAPFSPLGDTGSEPGDEIEMELTLLILFERSPVLADRSRGEVGKSSASPVGAVAVCPATAGSC